MRFVLHVLSGRKSLDREMCRFQSHLLARHSAGFCRTNMSGGPRAELNSSWVGDVSG